MQYKPVTAVWEITMGCNMRCKHCGSSCSTALPDELTTEEALAVCDQIGKLGLKWITLSGGEPLTRKDWSLLAKQLVKNNVIPNMITNGWMVTADIVDLAKSSGIGTFAISLDGLKETHDYMRKAGAFDHVTAALDLLKEKQVTAGIITTVTQKNLPELPKLRDLLISKGVTVWQIQIGLPMGNFMNQNDLMLQPEDIDKIIEFCYETIHEPNLNIYPADCIGYYNQKEIQIRNKAYHSSKPVLWEGCTAGKRSFGILHNGDILGCTSIRDKSFIEGSLRKNTLREIWDDDKNFVWSRDLKKSLLKGLCQTCQYGDTCLGGCPNTRLTLNGDVHSENKYCSYNFARNKIGEMVQHTPAGELQILGESFMKKSQWQLADILLTKAMEQNAKDIDMLNSHGYVNFMLGNYLTSIRSNEKAIELDPQNTYAYEGLGLSLAKNGNMEDGIRMLKKSAQLTDASYMDPYHDLAVLLMETGKIAEAHDVLDEAANKAADFPATNAKLYAMLSLAEKLILA